MDASRTPKAPVGHGPDKVLLLRVLTRGDRLYVDAPKPRPATR